MTHGLKELLVGAVYFAIGGAAFVAAQNYEMGNLLQMGPGYFPALVGGILVLLGLLSILAGLRRKLPNPIEPLSLEPLLLLLAGVISFAFLINRAGLVLAVAALLFFACFRRLLSHPLEVVVTYVVLTVFSAVVFITGVGMNVPLVWWQR